jgi:glycosyltransferase involved in cell wall biosynthesis
MPAVASRALVSVIVAVYQGERYIRGAVRSALAQSYADLEVLVVDDGSTDGTLAALEGITDPRLRVMTQPNAGTATARNAALAIARGKYIAFLDADDRWFREKIEIEVGLLADAPGPAIAYSSFFAVDDDGRVLHPGAICMASGNVFGALLDGDNFLLPSLSVFHRGIFDAIGAFDTGRYHEDHDVLLRATRRFPAYPTGRRLGFYRQSTSGKCRAILCDYERARGEELELVDGLTEQFTAEEIGRLRRNVLRGLYVRFLMYGYSDHARRLQGEVDLRALGGSGKGRLARFFAMTGINLLVAGRATVNAAYRLTIAGPWYPELRSADVDYDAARAE